MADSAYLLVDWLVSLPADDVQRNTGPHVPSGYCVPSYSTDATKDEQCQGEPLR